MFVWIVVDEAATADDRRVSLISSLFPEEVVTPPEPEQPNPAQRQTKKKAPCRWTAAERKAYNLGKQKASDRVLRSKRREQWLEEVWGVNRKDPGDPDMTDAPEVMGLRAIVQSHTENPSNKTQDDWIQDVWGVNRRTVKPGAMRRRVNARRRRAKNS